MFIGRKKLMAVAPIIEINTIADNSSPKMLDNDENTGTNTSKQKEMQH